ncbi:purine-cytosine permease family protein [Acidiphilium iwatense]|uniref:Cytosine permease n=1 Tax=Acidiphilium iwatense TaxID=768198 RepID=A0ABS9E0Y9_9PROT|nr:cytosine permease [Acidiphilium iwatense]MCF3947591.1 cytosine permease [Acidiphilium iwatense]
MKTADILTVESKGIARIDPDEAHGTPRALFRLWAAANVEFATITTGAIATGVFGLSAFDAIAAIVVANLIGCTLLGLFSTYGVEYGLPQMIQCVNWFGKPGNRFLSFLNFLNGFSWFAVNTVIGSYALHATLGTNIDQTIIVLTIVQVFIALIGHDFIVAAERWFFYFLTAVFVILTVLSFLHITHFPVPNAKSLAEVGGVSGAFLLTVSIMLSWLGGWILYSSDYTRYLCFRENRPQMKRRVFLNTFLGAFISCVWLECLGAFIGATVQLNSPSDLFTAWIPEWFRPLLILAIIVGTVSPNILNIYSASLSALASGIKLKQYQAALLTGLVGLAIAIFGHNNFYKHYELLLFFLGYVIIPRFPVMIIAHFWPRRSRWSGIGIGHLGFFAWLIGVLCSIPFFNQYPLFVGPFARAYPQCGDISFFVGAFATTIAYLVLTAPKFAEAREAVPSSVDLETP